MNHQNLRSLHTHKDSKFQSAESLSPFAYVFCLQWDPEEQDHTIHGLWPTNSDFATHKPFDQQVLKKQFQVSKAPNYFTKKFSLDSSSQVTLKDLLQQKWASLNGNPDENFWAHQWSKHGVHYSLTSPLIDESIAGSDLEFKYFMTALFLYAKTQVKPQFSQVHHQIYSYLSPNYDILDQEEFSIRI